MGVYLAHASSLTAALRGGMLRMTRSRTCLGTTCLGGEFNSIVIPVKTGIQCQQDQCMPPSVDSLDSRNKCTTC